MTALRSASRFEKKILAALNWRPAGEEEEP